MTTLISVILAAFSSSSSSSSDSDDYEYLVNINNSISKQMVVLKEIVIKTGRENRNCVKKYLEEIVPTYTEQEFRCHFRVSRKLYEQLCSGFAESRWYTCLCEKRRISQNIHIALFLWFAGHESCSFRDVGDRFDISIATVCRIINRVTMYISALSSQYIKWPCETKKLESSRFFGAKCGFSKAIGCIDGTHIIIDPPNARKDDYIDRKGNYSLCLQGVCDERKNFISIFVGYPGSSHDSWVFQNSELYSNISALCGEHYLLGDSAYPCTSNVVTPYRDNGHLSHAQKSFNIKLSSGRVAIEHTFGIMKQRFRQLYYCKLRGVEKLAHFIRACCVLHNVAYQDELEFNLDEISTQEVSEGYFQSAANARGNVVRDAIC